MSADIQTVVHLLNATLVSTQTKQAEAQLAQEQVKPLFSLLVLDIVENESLPMGTRQAGALFFKNYIKYNYITEEGTYKLPADEIVTLKSRLIGLMISMPRQLQAQLGDAISIIAESDFWERWDTLVQDLVSRLTVDNPKANNGVLEVAHSIFKRWRPLMASDDLFSEVNHVLKHFGAPFVQLLRSTDAQIEANRDNPVLLKEHFQTMTLLMKVFFDLSCQDLPPIFEENLADIAALLLKYLAYENPLLVTDDDTESGPLEYVKTAICEVSTLYMTKFEEDFGPLSGQFLTSSWNLLTTIGPETKYDILVSKALHFLTAVAAIDKHAQNFNRDEVLKEIVSKVVLPSVRLRDSDTEQFEDEPIAYIRRDLEGSDSDTRRRAATDFLRQLLEKFPPLVTQVVGQYINHYLDISKGNADDWMSKDTAVYLFSAIAAKGTTTAGQGVKTTNSLVNVVDFFSQHIANDLVDAAVHPILKVDAIKYLYTFRSQLSKDQWVAAFPHLVQKLADPNYVVYTYAAIAIERVLVLTNDANEHIFGKDDLTQYSGQLLEHLFALIEQDSRPEKVQENEFLMRCVMRVLIVIREAIIPLTDTVYQHLHHITTIIAQNPSNPNFYYYHFEALGALIRYSAPSDPQKLEAALAPAFGTVLQQDVQEFTSYVFQLLAALLDANPSEQLSEYYRSLIGPVLTPALWAQKGNVPALTRLLCAMIPRAKVEIQTTQIVPVVGLIQYLLAGKKQTETYGMDILESVVTYLEVSAIDSYLPQIIKDIFTRLAGSNPPETFKRRVVRFYHLVSSLDFGQPTAGRNNLLGADYFVKKCDVVQEGAFQTLYPGIILPGSLALVKPIDRKLAVVSLTKTLTDSEAFEVKYVKGWAKTCEHLLKLLETPPVLAAESDIITEADVNDLAFGVGFTQLNTCKKAVKDDWPEVTDVKSWVGSYLKSADTRRGGKVGAMVNERLTPAAKSVLLSYMQ